MPPDDGRQRDDDYPAEQSWDVSRRRRSIVGLVVSGGLTVFATMELVSAERDLLLALSWLWLGVSAAVGALILYRTRVAVDGDGVHVSTVLRRRTYRWDDIAVVRPASASEGRSNVQLVLSGGKVVNLPNVAGKFNAFRRWHDAVKADR